MGDLLLLASALVTPGVALWTLDKRLAGLAARFGVQYPAVSLAALDMKGYRTH